MGFLQGHFCGICPSMSESRAHLLVIDNYDSFTYNLVQAFSGLGAAVTVFRNDAVDVATALACQPTHVLLSPGPGRPENSGITVSLLQAVLGRLPVFGVCLGHQALAQLCGAEVIAAMQLMHGKASTITHDGRGLFSGLPQNVRVGRYHSLAVKRASIPDTLAVTAWTEDGEVMGLRHRQAQAVGVQFHPESILTPCGLSMMRNFLMISSLL